MSATPSTDRRGTPATPAPSWFSIARRPRWIALLVLVLAVAAAFAALAQWQAGRAVENATATDIRDTESAHPLVDVDTPQTSVTGEEAGQIVTIRGELVAGDSVILDDRLRSGTPTGVGGDRGYWLVGHLVDADGDSLAVALGWAADRATIEEARDAVDAEAGRAGGAPLELSGRYLASEAPQEADFEAGAQTALSTAELVNRWAEVPGLVWGGYLVAAEPAEGLQPIIAPAPEQETSLNWLNVFYAVEWVLFAGFAFYLWYRLVKDQLERELEEREALSDGPDDVGGRP